MDTLHQFRFVPVIALLACAAALATDRTRLPLALRALRKSLDAPPAAPRRPVPAWRRLLAFLLVFAAFALAAWV